MSDTSLIDACKALAPEADLVAAGAFQPRGTQGTLALGPAGVLAGAFLARNSHLPRYAILGVTASEILMFRAESFHAGWKPVELVERLPRDSTKVSTSQGVLVRKLTLEPAGGSPIKLESPRIGAWHGAGVLAALAGADAVPASRSLADSTEVTS
ncbi:MAG: hypothetical protein JWM06_2359 [Actinomycetia bacterium]|nr:hypothetical protein [Actinomycetes bacterium]